MRDSRDKATLSQLVQDTIAVVAFLFSSTLCKCYWANLYCSLYALIVDKPFKVSVKNWTIGLLDMLSKRTISL